MNLLNRCPRAPLPIEERTEKSIANSAASMEIRESGFNLQKAFFTDEFLKNHDAFRAIFKTESGRIMRHAE